MNPGKLSGSSRRDKAWHASSYLYMIIDKVQYLVWLGWSGQLLVIKEIEFIL